MSGTQRISLQPGFVLHQRPYRDTSALLEVFTRQHGRIGLVARGARSPKSRQRGLLQPFQPLLLSWSARGELGTLTGAEAAAGHYKLTGDALFAGFYVHELLLRLTQRNDPHPELFEHFVDCLHGLSMARGEVALRVFEKHLLESLGYALLLECEAESGEPIAEAQYYHYYLESGPMRAAEGSSHPLGIAGRSLRALEQERFDDAEVLQDAKRLLKAALALYLGDKPLQTREVLQGLRKL